MSAVSNTVEQTCIYNLLKRDAWLYVNLTAFYPFIVACSVSQVWKPLELILFEAMLLSAASSVLRFKSSAVLWNYLSYTVHAKNANNYS